MRSPPRDGALTAGSPLVLVSALEEQLHRERDAWRVRQREHDAARGDLQESNDLLAEQVAGLKAELRRAERSAGRDGANLEYLKNVLVKYLQRATTLDRVLPAIATILRFSPDELRSIRP